MSKILSNLTLATMLVGLFNPQLFVSQIKVDPNNYSAGTLLESKPYKRKLCHGIIPNLKKCRMQLVKQQCNVINIAGINSNRLICRVIVLKNLNFIK
jgi:hypothetical protein